MHPSVPIALFAAVAILLWISRNLQKKRERRQRPTKQWIAQVQKYWHRYDKLAELDGPPSDYDEHVADAWFTRHHYEQSVRIYRMRQEGMAQLASIQELTELEEQYALLKSIKARHFTHEQAERFASTAEDITTRYGHELLERARRDHDHEAFMRLRRISKSAPGHMTRIRSSLIFKEVPLDWDDLVVKFIRNPKLKDFRFVDGNVRRNDVLHMATEALRREQLKEAKIVLAFCAKSKGYRKKCFPYRDEIGPVLLAEVAKMVDTIHADRALFQGSRTMRVQLVR